MAYDQAEFLYESFTMHYENAKKAQQNGKINLAKQNLILAADSLLKLAKMETGEMKKARVDRAKRLIDLAKNINENSSSIGSQDASTRSSRKKDSKLTNKSNGDEEEGKQWVGAEIPSISFADVAGLNDVKESITVRMINPVKYPEKYAAYNKKSGGGVLLYGPPGTGKTMIAKAIAHEVGATFYAIKGSDIMSKWVGESEKNISSLFETARKDKLAIIFIDEMDSLFGQRGVDTHNDKRVNEFLQQIDGFVGRNPNLLLLGATNRPWDVDSAAVRSGRFSEKIYVPLPDSPARAFLLKKQLKKAPLCSNIDWNEIVVLTAGYSGADIDEICDRAKDIPLKKYIETDIMDEITMENIKYAISKVKPMVDDKEIARFEKYAGIDGRDIQEEYIDFNKDNKNNSVKSNENETFCNTTKKDDSISKSSSEEIEIILAENPIKLLPNTKPIIEFYLSNMYDKIYIEINGANYVCSKNIKNWITPELDIDKAGVYTATIIAKKPIVSLQVEFIKGIQENDMDI